MRYIVLFVLVLFSFCGCSKKQLVNRTKASSTKTSTKIDTVRTVTRDTIIMDSETQNLRYEIQQLSKDLFQLQYARSNNNQDHYDSILQVIQKQVVGDRSRLNIKVKDDQLHVDCECDGERQIIEVQQLKINKQDSTIVTLTETLTFEKKKSKFGQLIDKIQFAIMIIVIAAIAFILIKIFK